MSTAAEVVLKVGDKKYLAALKFKQIEELQEVCDKGIVELSRLIMGLQEPADNQERKKFITYMRETVRCGLMGGGMSRIDAEETVDSIMDKVPLLGIGKNKEGLPPKTGFRDLATDIMNGLFFGLDRIEVDTDGAGNAQAEEKADE